MTTRISLPALLLLAALIGLAACRGASPDAADAAPTDEPPPRAATLPAPTGPPLVENDAPAGICEDTANLLSRVDRAQKAGFRAVALDNRVGANDGDGIRGVRFIVIGEGLEYLKDEDTAPYCLLGGNEPECGAWPRDEAGRYTWGAGGPVVQPGRYDVFVEVVGGAADSLSGSDRCSWNFVMEITLR